MQAASTSAWIWDPSTSLYYNPGTLCWAAPQADGTWKYSTPVAPPRASPSPRPPSDTDSLDGEPLLPEDQTWPDEDLPAPSDAAIPPTTTPLLRLVVLRSPVIPSPQSIVLVDSETPLSIGRDKSFEARVRLKELLVSKAHATLFYGEEEGWAVVDAGSTHGTFVRTGEEGEVRLSESKMASVPRTLHHLDELRVGSTVFEIHIHASLACTSCSVSMDSSNLIPLLSTPPSTTADVPVPVYETKTKATREQDRRDKMRGLKAQFFPPSKASPSPSTSAPPKPAFVDRAKARRQRNGPSTTSHPIPTPPSPFFSIPGSTSSSTQSSAPPSNPFDANSRGALLLSKISSNPTSSAGGGGGGLGTLIQPRVISSTSSSGKAGLGSQPLVAITAIAGVGEKEGGKRGWREDGKERSWKRFREGEGSGL